MAKQKESGIRLYGWILSYLKQFGVLCTVFILLELLITAVGLSIPKIIQYFIDTIIPTRNADALASLIGWLIVGIAAMIAAKAINNILQRIIAEKSLHLIRLDMIKKIRQLGLSYLEQHPVGTMMQMVTAELNAVTEIYRNRLPAAFRMAVMVIISLALVISIHPLLTLIFIPSIILYNLFGAYFARKAALIGREAREVNRDLFATIYNFLSGMGDLRASARTNWYYKWIQSKFAHSLKVSTLEMVWLQYRGTIRKSIITFGLVLVFIFGIILVRNNTISVGEFVAFVLYYEIVIGRMTTLITNITEQRVLLYQVERIHEMMMETPQVTEAANPVPLGQAAGEMMFHHVDFGYTEQRPIVQDVTLHIKAGERCAIVGMSGGGKTTLFKLIGRYYDTTRGDIRIDGMTIRDVSLSDLRSNIGYVTQETYLFGTSIKDNIAFGNPDASQEQVEAAAQAANIHDYINSLPDGYETVVGERGITLSGGQKQRISIARMILKNPRIVLLDEATSALDNISEAEVQLAIDTLLRGRTTVTIAHRLSTIRHYDKIVVMHQGRIVEAGTYSELMAKKSYYYKLETRGEASDEQLEMVN